MGISKIVAIIAKTPGRRARSLALAAALEAVVLLSAATALAGTAAPAAPAPVLTLPPIAPVLPALTLPDPSLGVSLLTPGSTADQGVRGLDLGDGITLKPRFAAPPEHEVVDPSRRRAGREPWLELKVPLGR
jgi:hypothetical protein